MCISVFVFLFLFTFYAYYPGCVSVVPWETRRRQKWHAFAANGKTWHETQLTRLYFCNCFVFVDWFIFYILYSLILAANGNSWHKTQFQSNCIFVICICWLITWYLFSISYVLYFFAAGGKTWNGAQLMRLYFCNLYLYLLIHLIHTFLNKIFCIY